MRTWITIGVVVVLLVGGGIAWNVKRTAASPEVQRFAQCLTEKGTKMYGAWWCPHCKDQKALFGSAWRHVEYIECSLPGNPNVQTQECQSAGIQGYPTWEFSGGARRAGVLDFPELAEATGCALPTQSTP